MKQYEFLFKHFTTANLSNNNRLVALCSSDVSVFEFPNMNMITKFSQIKYPSSSCFSSNNQFLAVKSTLGNIGIYDLEKKVLISKSRHVNEAGNGSNILFTPDDKYIIDGDWRGNIRQIDIQNGTFKVIETNDNHMIRRIEYDDLEQVFHIQKFYRGGMNILDSSYTVISQWKYNIDKKQMNLMKETKKVHNHGGYFSYNQSQKQYASVGFSQRELNFVEIEVYDNMLDEILLRKPLEGETKRVKEYNVITQNGVHFIVKIDNNIYIYDIGDYELSLKKTFANANRINLSPDGRFLIVSEIVVEGPKNGRLWVLEIDGI
ncbi:MAG: hypothetical protein WC363_03345 [Candidatus Izemoplasmatales bacterium]